MENLRIFDLFRKQAEKTPQLTALASKVNGIWEEISYKTAFENAQKLTTVLFELGIKPAFGDVEKKDKIAIISDNRPEWIMTDLAVQMSGAVLVPVYPTILDADLLHILNESEVKIIFFEDYRIYNRYKHLLVKIPSLAHIISFDYIDGVKKFKKLILKDINFEKLNAITESISNEELSTIIYTSGTTGKPKGVMLSHKNIVSNIKNSNKVTHFLKEGDKVLSFLPLNHTFERFVNYLYFDLGVSVYFAESIEMIGENIREVKPIVFTAVPRLLEKIYEKIKFKSKELNSFQKNIFNWALRLGLRFDNKHKAPFYYNLQLRLADKLVFIKWRKALGGNLKAVICGSAALQTDINSLFTGAGIVIMEGYGLTETAPLISVNHYNKEDRVIGTVGRVIDNVLVKLAEDGEILCKGDNVMLGYYKQPELTKTSFTEDGWLKTGDIGAWENTHFLKIIDRKKEMFKTSTGKYVAPQVIENKLKECECINQIVVVGEGKKYVSALIVPNFEYLTRIYGQFFHENATTQEIINSKFIHEHYEEQLEMYNNNFNSYERIRKFKILLEEFSIENGLLTPKMSIKRKAVVDQYQQLIDDMYSKTDLF